MATLAGSKISRGEVQQILSDGRNDPARNPLLELEPVVHIQHRAGNMAKFVVASREACDRAQNTTTYRGVQYVHWVMHKCIMVKVGGKRNTRKVCKKQVNLCKTRGEICQSRGKIIIFAKQGG